MSENPIEPESKRTVDWEKYLAYGAAIVAVFVVVAALAVFIGVTLFGPPQLGTVPQNIISAL